MPSRFPIRRERATDLDTNTLRNVLEQYPIRMVVLFGSEASGDTHPRSDLDIAVEFDDSVNNRKQALLSLLTDLSMELERNDIDLSLVSDLKPRVGRAAFTEGVLLFGSRRRMELHQKRFERDVARLEDDRRSLRERFDAVIESVDSTLQSNENS